jgi:HAD superfamily hydrolase (TIGR01509 family)
MSPSRASSPRALLLDMDGTLFDSEPAHDRAWARALHGLGLQPGDWPTRYVGVADALIAQHAVGDFSLPMSASEVHARKEACYHDAEAATVRLFPGMRERLDIVARLGLPCALVTSGTRRDVGILLRVNSVEDAFPVIVAFEDVTNPKPHPAAYLLAAQRLRVGPSECLVVEDSESGARAAQAAGMEVIVAGGCSRPSWAPAFWFAERTHALDHAIALLEPHRIAAAGHS